MTPTCTTSLSIFFCSEPLGCALASAKHCSYGYSTHLSQRQSEAALKASLFEIEGNLFDLWERSTCEGKEQGDAARGSAVRARLGHYLSFIITFVSWWASSTLPVWQFSKYRCMSNVTTS